MPYTGLPAFIKDLEEHSELDRIRSFVDPLLEITEITDRITKKGGKALLFENNGTRFPVLINAYGSDNRMAMALGRTDLDSAGPQIISLFERFTGRQASFYKLLSSLKEITRLAKIIPSRSRKKGRCQQVVLNNPDLNIFPVLKCWPHDGGRYITLPVVHTIHPVTGKTNAGMYRMQVLDKKTTGMHWQLHKTGANHFEAWKNKGKIMPLTVTLGGDPVYAYCASAPLPEDIDEYLLAGFLRGKRVSLVKCLTNDLRIPSDADIVIEGYVDPSEKPVLEGPFGDHTGFYSLADYYPAFHITCITHAKDAVYPATIVGIPVQEDAWLAKATEKIFLAPVKLALQPEILDFHMPAAGVAHNLLLVKIRKSYPGQGRKIINSLFGAGQMMFTKYLVVTSGNTDLRNYRDLAGHILKNTDFTTDLLLNSGPMDVLDHSSEVFSIGGKLGVDATEKLDEELYKAAETSPGDLPVNQNPEQDAFLKTISESGGLIHIYEKDRSVVFLGLNNEKEKDLTDRIKKMFRERMHGSLRLIVAVDYNTDITDVSDVAWQLLGNSDPCRDMELLSVSTLFIDGTIKAFRKEVFPRRWPNVVTSSEETVKIIDSKWESLRLGRLIPSPSVKYSRLNRGNTPQVKFDNLL